MGKGETTKPNIIQRAAPIFNQQGYAGALIADVMKATEQTEELMNEASSYLLALANRNVQVYSANPKAKAATVTGSVAQGLCDHYSDVDMSVYYDTLPSEEELQAAREQLQASEWESGSKRGSSVLLQGDNVVSYSLSYLLNNFLLAPHSIYCHNAPI